MASSPYKAEKNLIYTFSFDLTDKSNTSIETVKCLLLFVYTHKNKKTLAPLEIKKTNVVRALGLLHLHKLLLEMRH